MAQYLDKTGLTTLWNKIKNTFALKSHTHTKSQIKDFPTIPTVNNPTITINQGGTKKGSFTLNQSGATTIDLTDNNTTYTAGAGLDLSNGVFSVKTGYTTNGKNYKVTTDNSGNLYVSVPWNNDTWRPVVDNLTTTDATKSLSANQGKVLKDLVDGKQPKGNYATTDTAQTISGLKTFKGNESNDISFVYYGNSTISGYGRYTAIRHALSFPWYNDIYQIGNIRGDSSDSLGFGITKSNNTIVARFVDTSTAYIGNNTIIHSGNIGLQNVNYANSAGSVAWGNVTGKPSTYTPSAHEHTSLKSNTDNRNTNTKPNDYNGILNIAGLKVNDKIGLDTNIYETYSCLIGVRGWSDSSGGNAHELAFTGNGHIVHRHGSTTSWGSWNRIAHVSDIPTKLPASNISMSFSNGVLTITYS